MNREHSCGAVVFTRKGGQVFYVVVQEQSGAYSFPKGHMEGNETELETAQREIFEETGVTAEADAIFAIQFKGDQWCVVFNMKYISGEPHSDGYENSEVLLLTPHEAVERPDITNMSRAILKSYISDGENRLNKGEYRSISLKAGEFEIFGV